MSGPPQHLISNTSTFISGSTPSCKKSGTLNSFILACIYVLFYIVCTNVHSSPSPESDAISKYFIQYVPLTSTPVKNIYIYTATIRVTGLRVLISAEGYAMLHKKEKKKKRRIDESKKGKRETRSI